MPLTNKEHFQPVPIPTHLAQADEVFYFPLTNEIFTTHDAYFERSIYCQSLIWTCAATGKSGLTFKEAVESEEEARILMKTFPEPLKTPVFFIMRYISIGSARDVCDMIYAFVCSRYFIGEPLDIIKDDRKLSGIVTKVVPPTDEEIEQFLNDDSNSLLQKQQQQTNNNNNNDNNSQNGVHHHKQQQDGSHDIDSKLKDESISEDLIAIEAMKSGKTVSFGINPKLYKYHVKLNEDTLEKINSSPAIKEDLVKQGLLLEDGTFIADTSIIIRPRGTFSKERVRLFMRQHLSEPKRSQNIVLKEDAISFLGNTTWEDIYAGLEPPQFNRKLNVNIRIKEPSISKLEPIVGVKPKQDENDDQKPEDFNENDNQPTTKKKKKTAANKNEAQDNSESLIQNDNAKTVKKRKRERIETPEEGVDKSLSISENGKADDVNDDNEITQTVKKKKKKYPYDPKKYSMPVPEGFDPELLTPTGKIDGRKLKSKKNKELIEELFAKSPYVAPVKKVKPPPVVTNEEEEKKKKAAAAAELAKERELEAKRKHEAAKLARQLERQKKEEERKRAANYLHEWEKKCEDLLRDDLRRLPQPTPLDCDIPPRLFGDAIFIIESFYNLHELYNFHEVSPDGINFDSLEEMLLDRNEGGALGSIIQFLLQTIFTMQPTGDGYGLYEQATKHNDTSIKSSNIEAPEGNSDDQKNHTVEENEQESITSDNGEVEEEEEDKEVNMNDLIGSAIKAAQEVKKNLRIPLPEMELSDSTVTEVLRLHLLQSGSFPKGRTIYNGWYSSREDPGLWLCMQEPDLIKKLSENSIYSLDIEERIKILHTLIYQLLSFIKTRLYIEAASEQLTELRKTYRKEAADFARWDRENCVKRVPGQEKENIEQNIEDYQREKTFRQEQLNQELLAIRIQLRKVQSVYGVHPIGRDRGYRRYWLFQSLPGLFVEQDDDCVGKCLDEPTPLYSTYEKLFQKENPLMHPVESDMIRAHSLNAPKVEKSEDSVPIKQEVEEVKKENGVENDDVKQEENHDEKVKDRDEKANDHEEKMNDQDDSDLEDTEAEHYDLLNIITDEMNFCTGDRSTCAVHGDKKPCQPRWWFYHTSEHIESLIECLNKRGYRESELLETLSAEKSIIKNWVNDCPSYKLNRHILEESGIRRSRRIKTRGNKRKAKKYDIA